MKKLFLLLTSLILSTLVFSQVPAGFNYQAVVRNSAGEIVASQTVKFKFSILQNSATGTPVYVETQSAATNDFGLANLVIGKGTKVTGDLDPSGWGIHPHFLKVEIDPNNDNSFRHLGTTQLMAVPYAFHAQTVEEGGSDNWGTQTVESDATLNGKGTSGSPLKIAQQGASTGQLLKWDGSSWTPGDVTGGTSLWQQDGDNIYFNLGKVGIGTITPQANLHLNGNDGLLIQGTKGSGAVQNFGKGVRMHFYPRKAAFRAGYAGASEWDDADIGEYSVAMGQYVKASGEGSVALGQGKATNYISVALGAATAEGPRSTAMGLSKASGDGATAMGWGTTASGLISTAIGYNIEAAGDYSVAIALNNESGTKVTQNNTMAIMGGKVGIGTVSPGAALHVHDRIRIRKDATYGSLYGELYHTGGGNGFRINANAGGGWADMHLQTDGTTRLFIESGGNVGIGTTTPSKKLYVEGSAGGTQAWNASDARYKKNVKTLQNSLDGILQLRGVQYEWKNQSEDESTGFDNKIHYGVIAQEVEEIFPYLIDNPGEAEEMKHVEYNGLIGILIEATKELKADNDRLKEENKLINLRLEKLENIIGLSAQKNYSIPQQDY